MAAAGVRPSWLNIRNALLAVAVLLTVGAGLFWFFKSSSVSSPDTNAANRAQLEYIAVMQQADRLDQAGRLHDEQQVLATYINSHPPKQYRYQPLLKLGDLSYDAHQDTQAITYYKAAESANGKVQLQDAIAIAVAAQALGDKSTAIYYYRQAIKLTPNDPQVANNISDYKAAIKYLGGTP